LTRYFGGAVLVHKLRCRVAGFSDITGFLSLPTCLWERQVILLTYVIELSESNLMIYLANFSACRYFCYTGNGLYLFLLKLLQIRN
jgi:hypothetical protein